NLVQTHAAPANDFGGTALTADPQLSPLVNHGGPTATDPLLPGSPAHDTGVPAVAAGVDQRGLARPSLVGLRGRYYTNLPSNLDGLIFPPHNAGSVDFL